MLVQSIQTCLVCLSLMLRKLGWPLLWPSTVHSLDIGRRSHKTLISHLKCDCTHDFFLFFLSMMERISVNVAEISVSSCWAESSNSSPTLPASWDVHWQGWHCFFTGGSIISCPWKCKLNYILCIGSREAGTVSLEGRSCVVQKFVVFCSDWRALRQHGLPLRLCWTLSVVLLLSPSVFLPFPLLSPALCL